MDLKKIGKFIAAKRQENGLTQEELAEKLDVSNRSISKWERGICLPDAQHMAQLCEMFKLTYNDLLSGAELKSSEYAKRAEENLAEFAEIETALNKKFFLYENVIGYLSSITFFILIFTASFTNELPTIIKASMIIFGFIILFVGVSFCLKIETETGKYACRRCGYRYIPKYSSVYFAPHFGRTRYMTCPKCHQKSWQRKIA